MFDWSQLRYVHTGVEARLFGVSDWLGARDFGKLGQVTSNQRSLADRSVFRGVSTWSSAQSSEEIFGHRARV